MHRSGFSRDEIARLVRLYGVPLPLIFLFPCLACADIQMTLEQPSVQQQVSGLGAISGWAFSTVAQAEVTVQLYIDGVAKEQVPCCAEREDVAQHFKDFPQARRSGFGLMLNFNQLSEGTHTIVVEAYDNVGSAAQTRIHTVTVTKPGGYETLSALAFTSDDDPTFGTDGQEILIKEAEVTDKKTGQIQKVNLSLAWQQERQTLAVVKSENVDEPKEGYNDDDGDGFTDYDDCDDSDKEINPKAQEICDDEIDNDCDGLTDENDRACEDTSDKQTTIRTELENPSGTSIGGIGPISGWTFTTAPNAVINSLRLRVDGNLIGDIPCCSERADVRDIYPDETDMLNTGFGTFVNFNLLDSGSHTFTVEAQNSAGETHKAEQQIQTVKVGESTFLDQFDLATATASIVGDSALQLENVQIRDQASQQTAQVTVSYQWEPSCQCFVPQAGCGNGSIETAEECDGLSLDGRSCASLGFNEGTLSCRPRCDDDDKDCERPCVLEVSACQGGQFLYVTNVVSNTVSVIDTITDTVVSTINVGRSPRGIAISPDGSVAYVTNFLDDTIAVLDTTTRTVVATITVGDGPSGVAFSLDGGKAYVVNGYGRTVTIIDTGAHKRSNTLRVGREPQAIAVTHDGKSAYVTNFKDNSVTELDLQTERSAATIFVERGPNGIAITPDDTKVYVVNHTSDTISIIDRVTKTVTKSLSVGVSPTKVAFAPGGEKAYIANSIASTISVIDTQDEEVEQTLVGVSGDNPIYRPDGLILPRGGARIYTTLFGEGFGNTVQVSSALTGSVLRIIEVGEGPFAVAISTGIEPPR